MRRMAVPAYPRGKLRLQAPQNPEYSQGWEGGLHLSLPRPSEVPGQPVHSPWEALCPLWGHPAALPLPLCTLQMPPAPSSVLPIWAALL